MSAIDFDMRVDKAKGSKGEDRVKVTLNGKFLPYSKTALPLSEERKDQE